MSISADVVNEALNLCGYNGPTVVGTAPNFDTSTAGIAAANLYGPAVQAVTRMSAWDFSRTTKALTLTGNPAPYPWSYEFFYPSDAVQIWQVTPQTTTDPNNPTPSDWLRGVSIVSNVQQSVIWTNISGAQAIYGGTPRENSWDSLFKAALVRYLAAEFAIALLGKPDLANSLFEQVGAMTQIGSSRSDT